MPTNEEMIAWLEEKIARDTEWLKHIEILEALDIVHLISEFVDETSPSYSETKYNIGIYQAILAALERKKPTVSKMSDGWWLHITGKDGKMADVFLGPNHGPIVESVLNDNADKGNVPVFNEEGNSNE